MSGIVRACVASLSIILLLGWSTSAQSTAADPGGSVTFTQLTAGNRFSCGLTEEGKAYCWGQDATGQLGIGPSVGQCAASKYATGPCARAPVAVAGEHRFESIAAGDNHVCAINDRGAVYCWGDGHFGQLGAAPQDRCPGSGMTVACSRTPVLVPIPAQVASIAAGEFLTCAVDVNGQPWCWGMVREPPGPHPITLDQPLTSISAGGDYVCGLTSSKTIRCWSWPQDLTKGASAVTSSTGWRNLTVGAEHACALDDAGEAFCWGSDADAALGIGPNPHDKFEEIPISAVATNQRFYMIATGVKRTCAIDTEGKLYCWGRVAESVPDDRCLNSNGVANTNDCTTRPIAVQEDHRFLTVAVGASHQCGVTIQRTTVCWGANESGQLGNGRLTATNHAAVVRTGGVTEREMARLDLWDQITWWLARGGGGLAGVVVLLLAGRGWVASLRGFGLAWFFVGGLTIWMISRVATTFTGADRGEGLAAALPAQLLVFVIGVMACRIAIAALDWWRRGVDDRPAKPIRTGAGIVPIAMVLVGWLGFYLVVTSEPRGGGDVGFGLAMLALIGSAAIGLALSAVAAALSIVTLRRRRNAFLAWLALGLAVLTLLAGAVQAVIMFWPSER